MLFQKSNNSCWKLGQILKWQCMKNEHIHLQDLCKPIYVRRPAQITHYLASSLFSGLYHNIHDQIKL